MVALKKNKNEMEADAVLLTDKKKEGGEAGDFEKMRLKQKVEDLSKKLGKAKQKCKSLD